MSDDADLGALLTVTRGDDARVRLDRVALIEAVDELGSISAAARRLGLSYKGAWDVIQSLNNLFDTPLVEAAPGGKGGRAAAPSSSPSAGFSPNWTRPWPRSTPTWRAVSHATCSGALE